ncbi:hypothetical protein IWW36_001969 [Coemansia brasiliensis]|uniref:Uncharacterized protein n=1 Tax=Coemansia brasiliensis TaxID=2650707 RepID=A0A9W8IAK0_9FUNG|nr:hypothetical protein IWW36_001969 [Coemansia brasiliensis]
MDIEDFQDALSELKIALVWPSLDKLDDNIEDIEGGLECCEVYVYNNEDDIKPQIEATFTSEEALELYGEERLAGDELIGLVHKMDPTKEFGKTTVEKLQELICEDEGKFITEYDKRFKANKLYSYYKISKQ